MLYDSVVEIVGSACVELPETSEKPLKRKRLSNSVGELARQTSKLEDDFDYQYNYNAQLIDDLAAANAKAEKYRLQVQQECVQNTLLTDSNSKLAVRVAILSRPQRLWRRLALTMTATTILLGGIIFWEKAVAPIDTVPECVRMLFVAWK